MKSQRIAAGGRGKMFVIVLDDGVPGALRPDLWLAD
jgi:hypothetical protein